MNQSRDKAFHPGRARAEMKYCGEPAPQRNVGQRELGDKDRGLFCTVGANRFQENLVGDPSTLSHIYMPLGLVAFNFLEFQGAPWTSQRA